MSNIRMKQNQQYFPCKISESDSESVKLKDLKNKQFKLRGNHIKPSHQTGSLIFSSQTYLVYVCYVYTLHTF